jgi:glucokinase
VLGLCLIAAAAGALAPRALAASPGDAAGITQSAATGGHTGEAVAMFCAMLGTVAANLALTLGARGGIYIAGGIVPKLGDRFANSQFRARFEDKGRFRDYLARVPTFVITHPHAALIGAAQLLNDDSP